MGDEKKKNSGKAVIILLIINTLLLLAILCRLGCFSGGTGFCPLKKKAFCPLSQKGSTTTELQQKGSGTQQP